MLDLLLILADDPMPEPTDVKAGPLGFAVWIFMILAVVVIGVSLSRQLRKAQAAKDAGLFGDEPADSHQTDSQDAGPGDTEPRG